VQWRRRGAQLYCGNRYVWRNEHGGRMLGPAGLDSLLFHSITRALILPWRFPWC
jgi:hypothetical protein